MKKYSLLFVLSVIMLISCTSEEKTTYYLIRHAEKDRTNPTNVNPSLTIKGEQRAQNWAVYFKDLKIDAVYTTKYFRTIETATPTAKTKGLELQYYDPRNMYDSVFQKATKGKSVLIVGHSNTTPIFANKIIQANSDKSIENESYTNMDDNDNASLYKVEIKGENVKSSVEKINLES